MLNLLGLDTHGKGMWVDLTGFDPQTLEGLAQWFVHRLGMGSALGQMIGFIEAFYQE